MENVRKLKLYQERCFINSLLYQQSMDYNIFLKNIINIPLILISGLLTILNSIMDEKDMKIVNIVLNGTVGLILGIMNNFKINDKIAVFKNYKNKIIKLQHKIDSFLNTSGNIDAKDAELIVAEYDTLLDEVEFPIEEFIKRRIKKKYNKFNLPLSLMTTEDCSGELCCIKTVEPDVEPTAII